MCEIEIGQDLKDWTPIIKESDWQEPIRVFEPEPRGEGSEAFVNWMLNLFQGVILPVTSGSALDLQGVDILIRSNGPTWGIQVKSSKGGMEIFKQKGKLSRNIVLLWVNTQDKKSRRKLFALLLPFLKSQGFEMKGEVKSTLMKLQKLHKAGIKSFPIVRNRVSSFNNSELKLLCNLGYLEKKGGAYVV